MSPGRKSPHGDIITPMPRCAMKIVSAASPGHLVSATVRVEIRAWRDIHLVQ